MLFSVTIDLINCTSMGTTGCYGVEAETFKDAIEKVKKAETYAVDFEELDDKLTFKIFPYKGEEGFEKFERLYYYCVMKKEPLKII